MAMYGSSLIHSILRIPDGESLVIGWRMAGLMETEMKLDMIIAPGR